MGSPTPAPKRLTRRALLFGGAAVVALGAAAAVGIEDDIIPGRNTFYRLFGLDGADGHIPKIQPGPALTGKFVSEARLGATVGWTISYPPGSTPGDALPVLIALHGSNGSHNSAFGASLGLDRFLAQSVAQGHAPFAIASIDGGNSYWHHRESGEDAAAMVTGEFRELLKRHGLSTARIGILGWSMGGFGALQIAGLLGSAEVACVIAESPALWQTFGAATRGSFDDEADFAANDAFGRQHTLVGIPVRVDCGTGDGFYPNALKYVAGFTTKPAGGFEAGGHTEGYWRRMAPAQLAFAAKHLAA